MRLDCPNPFCDGYGNLDISVSSNGGAWKPGGCKVGPHPPTPSDYRWPQKREQDPLSLPVKEEPQ